MRRAAARRRGLMMSAGLDPLAAAILAEVNPYKYVRVGEASGIVAADYQGNGDGTYINTPTLGVAGPPGADGDTAVTLARASSERVDFAFDANLDGMTAVTLGCFFKTTTTGTPMTLIGNWGGTSGDRIYLLHVTAANVLTFFMYDGGTGIHLAADSTSYADGNLHFVMADWDSAGDKKLRLYVDGPQTAISATSTMNNMQTSPAGSVLHFGANGETGSETNLYDGTLDEMFIGRNVAAGVSASNTIFTASGL